MVKRNKIRQAPKKKINVRAMLFSLLLVLVVALSIAAALLLEPEKPRVALLKDFDVLGETAQIAFRAADQKSGIRSIEVLIEQNGKAKKLHSESHARQNWFLHAGPHEISGSVPFDARKIKVKDGEAELIISVRDFSWKGMLKGNETVLRRQLVIDTQPPKIIPAYTQRYIMPGGSGIVIYRLSEPAVEHGVMLNEHFFPGFVLQEGENKYISYIALAWNAEAGNGEITASDRAGNRAASKFSMILKKNRDKFDKINISDSFLQSKIPEFSQYYPQLQGTDIEKFIFINQEVRKQNAAKIAQLCGAPHPQRLWRDRFLRMPGASRAGYADQRTYFYKGKAVDRQTHLGMDIASTTYVEIKAANTGKVIYADYLGIYGYMIILDHGQGVFSLYSHLSRIDTSLDALVEKGAVIARSGATGMAGGDHLHFSMLVNGLFTNPLEWWDPNWVDININNIIKDNQM